MSTTLVERVEEVVAPSEPTVADDLTRAAAFLMEHNWLQHSLTDGRGAYCMAGALAAVTNAEFDSKSIIHGGDRYRDARLVVWHVIDDFLGRWNDQPGRTKAEVVTALRNAAEKARQ